MLSSSRAANSINLAMIVLGITLGLSSGLVTTFHTWLRGHLPTQSAPGAATPPDTSFSDQFDQSLAAYTQNGQTGTTGTAGGVMTA